MPSESTILPLAPCPVRQTLGMLRESDGTRLGMTPTTFAGKYRYRTWTVFSVALCSLLALILLPTITALQRSREIYEQIRAMQVDQERSHRRLDNISRGLYRISILIREFLLDTSPELARDYLSQLTKQRSGIQKEIFELERRGEPRNAAAIAALRTVTESYWQSVLPIFEWTPEERARHAIYFLRQEQRPRRESIVAITDEIRAVNDAFYQKRYEAVNSSEREFRDGVKRVMYLTLLAGLIVAAASVIRIAWLEKRFLEQHQQAQRTGEEMRNLSIQLRHAQEEERKVLSRELHDDVGQKLTALRMELGTMERLRYSEGEEFAERLADTKQLAEQSLRSIRDMAAGLRPTMLDDLGLGPALQRQARQFARHTGVSVAVEAQGELNALPERHKVYIYRIVQEGLTNSARHAKAKRVIVTVTGTPDAVEVSVSDDGTGFSPQESAHSGTGLIGIEERVRELGGTLRIDSQPGTGTTLLARFPVSNGSA